MSKKPSAKAAAKQEAKEVAQEIQAKANEVASDAQSQMQDVAQQTKEQARELADQAQTQAKSAVASRKNQAVNELGSVAQAFRQSSNQLRQQDQDALAQYTDQVAHQLDRVTGYLDDRGVDDLLEDVEGFARRQPEVFIGGAFALGLAAARFFKSSAERRRSRYYGYETTAYGPGSYNQPAWVDDVRQPGYQRAQARRTTTPYDFDSYNTVFRRHHDSRFGRVGNGNTYTRYEPAYRYGYDLASDVNYSDQGDWTRLEPVAQRHWESEHDSDTAWEEVKDAVQHAWRTVRNTL